MDVARPTTGVAVAHAPKRTTRERGGRVRNVLRTLRRLPPYRQLVGTRLAMQIIADELLGRSVRRRIRVADEELVVRTGTPDLEVVRDCLVIEEYGDVSVPDPRFIIDAGAHIGASAIYFARKFPLARIVALEPDEDNFALLVENTRRYENVVPVRAALWSVPGERELADRGTGSWGYTVAETLNETRSSGQLIECVTIGSLLDSFEFDSVDILKMDIEGGEFDVLNSSNDWIDGVRVLTLETHDRIVPGCSRAFYLATRGFHRFDTNGEKVTAYR